jgi:hypothetical protein
MNNMTLFIQRSNIANFIRRLENEVQLDRRALLHHLLLEKENRYGYHVKQLEIAVAHIDDGERRVARQRDLINGLRAACQDTTVVEQLLSSLQQTQTLFLDYRSRLTKDLEPRRIRSNVTATPASDRILVKGRFAGVFLVVMTMLLAGCDPPYLADAYTSSTPKPASFDANNMARMPVAVLGLVAPGNLLGFGPTMSEALSGALREVTPPIREIPTNETLNRLTDQGLATEYGDLREGFARNGILDRERLRRIGQELGSRYVLLPGLTQFDESIIDKYEAAGIKLLRNRVTTLRLWLQLWDARTGHIVWESSGEITAATVFLSAKQTVALEKTTKKLLVRMIQDGLIGSKTQTQVMVDH